MKKLKDIIKILFWPLLFMICQFFIICLFTLFYVFCNPQLDVNSSAAINAVMDYIDQNTLFILVIQSIIFIPVFYRIYKKYNDDDIKFDIQIYFKFTFVSILLSIILNFLSIMLRIFMNVEMINNSITFTILLGTGILGPILEELLFRGTVYEGFKRIFEDKVAFNLSVFIFAIFHTGGIFQVVFAFIIGYYLTYIYKKYHDVRLSIIAHITVNITSLLVSPLILSLF